MKTINEKEGMFSLFGEMTVSAVEKLYNENKTKGYADAGGKSFLIPEGNLTGNAITFQTGKTVSVSAGYLNLVAKKSQSVGFWFNGVHENNETYSDKFVGCTIDELKQIAKRPTAKLVVESISYSGGTKSLLKLKAILN